MERTLFGFVRFTTILLCGLAGTLPHQAFAQQYYGPIYYSQSTSTEILGSSDCLGTNGQISYDSTYQLIVPAKYLPQVPATLSGLEVINDSATNSLTYEQLQIRVANTPASSLSPTFGSNLVSPFIAVNGTNVLIAYNRGAWSPLPIVSGFRHDGTSAIVVEIRKSINSSSYPLGVGIQIQTTSMPPRSDLPPALFSRSSFGGGGFTSAIATFSSPVPIKVLLLFNDVPTTTIRGDISGGPLLTFHRGGRASLAIHAPPGSRYLLLADASFGSALPVAGVSGRFLLSPTFSPLTAGSVSASGVEEMTSRIPRDPTLVGLPVVFQSIVAVGGNLFFTNGVDAIIR